MKNLDITDDISVVIGGAFPQCNTSVFLGNELTIIDPGCNLMHLRFFLQKRGYEMRDIKNVILTHIHPDHITHTAKIHDNSKCRVVANEITAPLYDEKEEMKRFLGFHPDHKVRPFWEQLVNEKMYGALDQGKVNEIVSEGDRFVFGDHSVRVVMTPGHLPDHMCLEIEDLGVIIGSDMDCTPFGPFYGHPNSSLHDFEKSIYRIIDGKYQGLISGHLDEPLIHNVEHSLLEFWKHVEKRENIIYNSIASGAKSIDDIMMMPIIYSATTNIVYLQFERWMIEHHVDSLISRGLVEDSEGTLTAV